MASAGEATPGDAGAGSADGDPPVRMSPEAQAELRIRIAHQVASALQDPRRGRGHDASASDGSWYSILAYAGLSVGGVGGGGAYVEPTPPPIQPGVLPEVLLSDFEPYLRRTRLLGSPRTSEDEASRESSRESSTEDAVAFSSHPGRGPAPRGRTDEERAPSASPGAGSRDDADVVVDAAAAAADDPLRLVPPAFFEEAFELSDPAAFAAVCGDAYAPDATHVSIAARSLMARAPFARDGESNGSSDVAERALQETLGVHLDVVETRLTRAVERRSAQFMDAASQVNDLVDAVERARVTCAGARRVTRRAAALVHEGHKKLDTLNRLRSNLAFIERACHVLVKLRDARQDLALFVEAEEHAGALEAAEEVRAIQKDPALAGVACAGDALKKNVAEIEALCGGAVAEQWRDCALVPRGATAQRGVGAPAPESCFAIVGAAARDAGLSPPPAGEWERFSYARDSDDDDVETSVFSALSTKDAFWGESRGGLGPNERSFADAAEAVYPRLTRALRASCVGKESNASSSPGGVAGDAMRLWSDAAAKDVAAAMRRAARAALVAAGAGGDTPRAKGTKNNQKQNSLPQALGALPETVLARVLETAAAAAHEHFARVAMCATWTRRALGVFAVSRGGSASSLPRVDSSVSAASASSAASSEMEEEPADRLETAFGFETFDDDAETDESARGSEVAASSVVRAAQEAARRAPAHRRAAIASAASDAARHVADAAQRTFAEFLLGFESETGRDGKDESSFSSARKNESAKAGRDVAEKNARDHFATVDVCEAFARAAETLGRRRCLALRSAVTRRSARWLARFAADATEALNDALETETWAAVRRDEDEDEDEDGPDPDAKTKDGDEKNKVVASARLASRVSREFLRFARRAPALAPDVARRVSELVRVYNARSCRLVLGAEATRNASRLKSVTAAHLAATHGALRFLAGTSVLRAARAELSPLVVTRARRDAWEKEVSKTARDLDVHCAEIRLKLVAIMRERCDARCAEITGEGECSFRTAETEADASRPRRSENFFAETAEAVTRELGTIGRVVGEHLEKQDADEVFLKIAAVFDAGLGAALESAVSAEGSEAGKKTRGAAAAAAAAEALARLTARDAREAAPALARLGATGGTDVTE